MWKSALAQETIQKFRRVAFTAIVLSVISALIESVAGVGGRIRIVDLTMMLLERPFWIVLVGFWAVFVYTRLHRVSWPEAIDHVLSFAPIVLIIPIVNGIVAWLGLEASVPSFVNVLEVPVSLLSFGWLPRPISSAGLLVCVLVIAVLFIMHGWKGKCSARSILGAVLVWLGGVFGLFLLPSFFSWVIVSSDVSPLNAGPNVLARSWVAFSQEGYWWRSVVDRFPGILEGEAEASVRLLQFVLIWISVVGAALTLLFRYSIFSVRQLVAQSKPVRGLSFLGAAFFGLWIGRIFDGAFFVRAIDLIALILYVIALGAIWLVSVWRNDLHDPREEATIRLIWVGPGSLVIAGVSTWFLGWPVFISLLSFLLLQEALSAPATRWKERWFGGGVLALSSVCVVLSGIFFALRTASVPLLPARIWLTVTVFYLLQAFLKAFRWSPILLSWVTTHLRIPPRMAIPVVLALSYLLVPLLSGWIIVWWIALPCAAIALLPLLGGGRWDERKIVGWQTAFILISFLLLTIYPPR